MMDGIPAVETLALIRQHADRRLSAEELDAYVSAEMTADERAEIRSLIVWFNRRYPTPLQRLAYVRRAMRNARQLAASGKLGSGGAR